MDDDANAAEPSTALASPETETDRARVLVFLCYRQVDGVRTAEWVFDLLHGSKLEDEGQADIEVYFDRTARVVGDWREIHEPSLKSARSLIFVCSPGAYSQQEGDDWVHMELDWWLKNRESPPILIDSTKSEGRWLPRSIKKRWPHLQRVNLDLDLIASLSDGDRQRHIAPMLSQIKSGITRGAAEVAFEDLRRQRRLTKIASVLAVLFLAVGVLAVFFGLRSRAAKVRAQHARGIALEQMRGAVGTLSSVTERASRIQDSTEAREMVGEAVAGYNRVLAGPSLDEPDFLFERAWMLNRLAEALRKFRGDGGNLIGPRPPVYITDPEIAAQQAIAILERLVASDDHWRYRLELGDAWLAAAENSMVHDRFEEGATRARAAIAQFEQLVAECDSSLCHRQLAYGWRLLGDALYDQVGKKAQSLDAYDRAAESIDKAVVAGRPDGEDDDDGGSESTARDYALEIGLRRIHVRRDLQRPFEELARQLCKDGYRLAKDLRGRDPARAEHVASHGVDLCAADEPSSEANMLNLRGDIYASGERMLDALADFRKAVLILAKMDDRDAQQDSLYAGIMNNVVDIQQEHPDLPRCGLSPHVEIMEHALEMQQKSIAAVPKDLGFREFRRNHRVVLGRALLKAKRPADAALQIRSLLADIRADAEVTRRAGDKPTISLRDVQRHCLIAAGLAQRVPDRAAVKEALECHLELRDWVDPEVLSADGIAEAQLTAKILSEHASIVHDDDPSRAATDCEEANRIMRILVAANPLAPALAGASDRIATQCARL